MSVDRIGPSPRQIRESGVAHRAKMVLLGFLTFGALACGVSADINIGKTCGEVGPGDTATTALSEAGFNGPYTDPNGNPIVRVTVRHKEQGAVNKTVTSDNVLVENPVVHEGDVVCVSSK